MHERQDRGRIDGSFGRQTLTAPTRIEQVGRSEGPLYERYKQLWGNGRKVHRGGVTLFCEQRLLQATQGTQDIDIDVGCPTLCTTRGKTAAESIGGRVQESSVSRSVGTFQGTHIVSHGFVQGGDTTPTHDGGGRGIRETRVAFVQSHVQIANHVQDQGQGHGAASNHGGLSTRTVQGKIKVANVPTDGAAAFQTRHDKIIPVIGCTKIIQVQFKNGKKFAIGTPEDVGNLVAFLASDEASYITGTEIIIDGGLSSRYAD